MSVKLKPVSTIIMDFGLEEYGDGHEYFAECCRKRMNDKYVPEDTKALIDESYIDGECNIVYDQKYAGYQYYGQRKDGSRPVRNYSKPGTGPYWDKQMLSAESEQLVKDMTDFIKKRGNK